MAETRESAHESVGSRDSARGFCPTTRRYRIRVEGTLDPSWSPRLGGLRIAAADDAEGSSSSVLEGVLPDRASLIGVLNSLHDLNLTLLSVETTDLAPSTDGSTSKEVEE